MIDTRKLLALSTDPLRVLRGVGRRLSTLGAPPPPPPEPQVLPPSADSPASYWTQHVVTRHRAFRDREESLSYLGWRNDQYPGYIDLMPVSGQEGRVVLDYGCGPGNDLVGFAEFSRPARLIGMDLSPTALQQSRERLALHGAVAELVRLDEGTPRLPLEDAGVDYIHSSGVLHHTPDPVAILREFLRVLRPGGEARIMVYNRDSVWMHLRAAYLLAIRDSRYASLTLREVFRRSTDGESCPISNAYTPAEFCALGETAGFAATFLGAAVSLTELQDLQASRWDAIASPALAAEHRRFLLDLRVDDAGIPRYRGAVAGIDACFSFRKR